MIIIYNMKVIYIILILFIIYLYLIKEDFMLWNNATRFPKSSYDIRNDPNLVYRNSGSGTLESIGHLYSPYVFTPSGKLLRLSGNKNEIKLF